eukprot:TRINITY_DN609_c0_g1_i1.p1 TRINITY_DN609_c0_g1~~TRINITY_DN609_c0_g1_i1.p1  ORF type:complete len:493 (-),score=87.28 TRINITY_DN609_c0_g1_i1:460-1872(-)
MEFDDADHDADETITARGWVMRRGHCKRLQAPKRGRAAIWAEIQGQGKEVMRGRSIFKRSVNAPKKRESSPPEYRGRHGQDYTAQRRRAKLRKTAQADYEEALLPHVHDYDHIFEACEVEHDAFDVEAETSPVFGCDASMESWIYIFDKSDEDVPSTASNISSSDDEGSSSEASWELFEAKCRKTTPWQLAVARAELAAADYRKSQALRPESTQGRTKIRPRRSKSKVSWKKPEIWTVLKQRYNISLRQGDDKSPFEDFRRSFLEGNMKEVGEALCNAYGSGQEVHMKTTPLSSEVKKQFLNACHGGLQGQLRPVWHGTSESNLSSIYERGLLIPGQDNTLRVVNGSAYGLGIYTATANDPQVSINYCRGGRKLLLCGLLDADCEKQVKKVGSFVVIFNAKRVAPLYEASLPTGPYAASKPRPLPQLPQTAVVQPSPQRKKKSHVAVKMLLGPVAAYLSRRAARKRRDGF